MSYGVENCLGCSTHRKEMAKVIKCEMGMLAKMTLQVQAVTVYSLKQFSSRYILCFRLKDS